MAQTRLGKHHGPREDASPIAPIYWELRLSILIPVYNERTVEERSLAQVLAAPLPENMDRELIIVDDCSTDGTAAILDRMASEEPSIRLPV